MPFVKGRDKINILMKTVAALAAIIMIGGGSCLAETSVKAEVDKRSITADETITYKLTVVSSDLQISPPDFPEFTRFDLLSQSQSSSFSFSGEGARTMLVYVLVLLPKETGTLEIPAASVTAEGKRLSTEKFSIRVAPGSGRSRGSQPAPESPKKQLPPELLGKEPRYDI